VTEQKEVGRSDGGGITFVKRMVEGDKDRGGKKEEIKI